MIDPLKFLGDIQENPWLGIFEQIDMDQKRMPVDLPMKQLYLARLFAALGFRQIAEIGVLKGGFSATLWKENREATIYCVDPWEAYEGYAEPYTQQAMDEIHSIAVKRLAGMGCRIIRKTSMEALGDFEDESLDAVYIDANHRFEYVTQDIAGWSKKVRSGGIVSGHD